MVGNIGTAVERIARECMAWNYGTPSATAVERSEIFEEFCEDIIPDNCGAQYVFLQVAQCLRIPLEDIISAFMRSVFSFLDMKEFEYLNSYVSFAY
jgi:hypothetical protein